MLSNHLTKEPAQNHTVTVIATCLDFEGWVLPDADFPEQIRLDMFSRMSKSSRLCGAKLKNHYLLCTVLTSQQRPVHAVSVDEEQKNSLLCMMKKNLCNRLRFPPVRKDAALQRQPREPCNRVRDALNLLLFNLYSRNKRCPPDLSPSLPREIKLSGIIRSQSGGWRGNRTLILMHLALQETWSPLFPHWPGNV